MDHIRQTIDRLLGLCAPDFPNQLAMANQILEGLELLHLQLSTQGRLVPLATIVAGKRKLAGYGPCPHDLTTVPLAATSVGQPVPNIAQVMKGLKAAGVDVDPTNAVDSALFKIPPLAGWSPCYYPAAPSVFRSDFRDLRNSTVDEQRATKGLPPLQRGTVTRAVLDLGKLQEKSLEPHLASTHEIVDYLLDLAVRARHLGLDPNQLIRSLIPDGLAEIGIRGRGAMVMVSRTRGLAIVSATGSEKTPYIGALYLAG